MSEEPVYRTLIQVEIFSRGPLFPEGQLVGELWEPLQQAIEDAIDGDKIGDWTVLGDKVVEGGELRVGLVAIGNDGSFFDDPWGDEE